MQLARTVLGFDYGQRRIGVAVGQELTASARPLAVLSGRKTADDGRYLPDWQGIERLIEEWRPELLVVGLPLHADGSANAVSAAVRQFAEELARRFGLTVTTVDERLSSAAASERRPRHKAKKAKPIDDTAAAVILETWLRLPPEQRTSAISAATSI